MTVKTNNRRLKNYLIRKDLQFPILTANLVFLFIVASVLIGVLLSPLYHDMIHAQDPWVKNLTGNLFIILLHRLAIAMLLILIVSACHQIIFSHRYCGPLVNFGYTFNKMANGDFTRKVNLRKGDLLKDEAEKVNGIIDRLNADGKDFTKALVRMETIIEQLEGQTLSTETKEVVEQLENTVSDWKGTLDRWRLISS